MNLPTAQELAASNNDLLDLARRLALALADEVVYAGAEAAEASLVVLAEARIKLDLGEEFDKINSLGDYSPPDDGRTSEDLPFGSR